MLTYKKVKSSQHVGSPFNRWDVSLGDKVLGTLYERNDGKWEVWSCDGKHLGVAENMYHGGKIIHPES